MFQSTEAQHKRTLCTRPMFPIKPDHALYLSSAMHAAACLCVTALLLAPLTIAVLWHQLVQGALLVLFVIAFFVSMFRQLQEQALLQRSNAIAAVATLYVVAIVIQIIFIVVDVAAPPSTETQQAHRLSAYIATVWATSGPTAVWLLVR